MSTIIYPVVPAQLRRACLEAAELLAPAERASLTPWHGLPLADNPPGATPDDPADGAPATCFPLGKWGSVLAGLRAELDNLYMLGLAADHELWTGTDEANADTQLEGWREAFAAPLDTPLLRSSELRLSALDALRCTIGAQRILTAHPDARVYLAPLGNLREAAEILRRLGRSPGSELS